MRSSSSARFAVAELRVATVRVDQRVGQVRVVENALTHWRRARRSTPGSRGQAPRRSAAPGCPEWPGQPTNGQLIWAAARGNVGRRAAQNLGLHYQPPHLAAQLHEFVVLGAGLAVDDAVVDVGLADSAAHQLH